MKNYRKLFVFILFLICSNVYCQSKVNIDNVDLNSLDIYAKIFGIAITGLGTLFGLPLAVMNFRKTKAEIKKIELEADALLQNSNIPKNIEKYEGYKINIENSTDVNVKVTSDPRFLGPLLLLLDFIIAWIILTLMNHFLGAFLPRIIESAITIITACLLLIPILKESLRVKKILKPKK